MATAHDCVSTVLVSIDEEGLHIVPTLTNETTSISNSEVFNGYTVNLTDAGTCTGDTNAECAAHSNRTKGTVIPPARSARLNTKGHKSIRYGRVEVVAKLPAAAWLRPAICASSVLTAD
ncbi:hypothetical protein PHISP_02528 [Aspergillus sp. HF37]|nr:hypothetical protein PHISP_02528 [Aspergillus sp. HF37]